MGSKNGKYDVEHGNARYQRHGISLSESNGTLPKQSSRKEIESTPKCLHQSELMDMSSNEEYLSIVWLDKEVYSRPANTDIEVKLKNLIRYVRIFDQVDACEKYIRQIGTMNTINQIQPERLFFIISTTLAPTLLPLLHDLPQVKYVYIFGKAKSISKRHELRLMKNKKVKGIFHSSRGLIAQITQDRNANNEIQ